MTVDYYLSKGFDRPMAEYLASGRKQITSVTPQCDFSLLLTFNNGERRKLDCTSFLRPGTVFEPFLNYESFKRVYIDDENAVCWDIDPTVDSNVVWSNKVDLSPDSCYVDSVPVRN